MGLPPAVRTQLQARLTKIIQGLPPTYQLAYMRYMAQNGHANPVPLPTQGLLGYVDGGLGQWGALATFAMSAGGGALISAVAQGGVSIYEAKQTSNLQKNLQSNALQASAQQQAEALAAQEKVQAALADAQTQAAKIAGAAEVATAPQHTETAMWLGIGAASLAGLGVLIFIATRRPAAAVAAAS